MSTHWMIKSCCAFQFSGSIPLTDAVTLQVSLLSTRRRDSSRLSPGLVVGFGFSMAMMPPSLFLLGPHMLTYAPAPR